MAITINGTGSITGISVGGIPDGTVDTDVLAANAVTYAKIGTTEQGQLCKAWVSFNGTSTVTIRAQYNVSSITDNGTGDYTVNFTTALADANYSAVAGGNCTGATFTVAQPNTNGSFAYVAPTTSACRFLFSNNTAAKDIDVCNVAIFR
jgi:hypothetical protein